MQDYPNLYKFKNLDPHPMHLCSATLFIRELIERKAESHFTDMNLRDEQRKATANRLGYRYGFIDKDQKHHYRFYFLPCALRTEMRAAKRSLSLEHATLTMIHHGFLIVENNSALAPTPFLTETGKPALCYTVTSEVLNYGNKVYELEPWSKQEG